MQFKTIRKPRQGWFNPFRYRVLPEPEVESFEVAALREPRTRFFKAVERSLPDITAGVRTMTERYGEHRFRLACVRMEIFDLKSHNSYGSNAEGIERVGRSFASEVIARITHPIDPLPPVSLSSTVLALARGIADDAAFDRLPILADALQDGGCDDPLLLDHLRTCTDHTPSCWVVEMILDATR